MDNKTYSEKLKDPRWTIFSNSVKKVYDNRCVGCGCEENLNTHHLIYKKGVAPWDYSLNEVTVMCKSCHNEFHKNEIKLKEILMNNRLMFGYEFGIIIKVIELMSNIGTNDYRKIYDFVMNLEENSANF